MKYLQTKQLERDILQNESIIHRQSSVKKEEEKKKLLFCFMAIF